MKKMFVIGMALLLSVTLLAQTKHENDQSTITVKLDDLTCTTSLGTGTFNAMAWMFSASNTTSSSSGGGGGAGKAEVSALIVQKRFDECSPAMFAAVATGKHFKGLTLTQQDKKDIIMTVTLTDVIVSSYKLGGNEEAKSPSETIDFDAAKICINDVESGNKACFDFKTQTGS
jgi:type VI protein secretion system component Hcp